MVGPQPARYRLAVGSKVTSSGRVEIFGDRFCLNQKANLNACSARIFCTTNPFNERVKFSKYFSGIKTEVRTHEGKVITFSNIIV